MFDPDSIIASLLAQEAVSQEAASIEATVIRNAPKKERGTHSSKPKFEGGKAQVVKAKTGEAIFGLSLPERRPFPEGTKEPSLESCKLFMSEMLSAGRRVSDTGKRFTDEREVRNDQIKALAGFVGYETQESFATQEQAARAIAQRIISGRKATGPTRAEQRAAISEALDSGRAIVTTTGLCDHDAKRLANLQANEVALVDSICDYEKIADDQGKTISERAHAKGMASLERERLEHVRKDLTAIANGASFIRAIDS
jgi:hypothetical protein